MKKILIFLGILSVLASGVYFYIYKNHRDISKEDALIVNGLSIVKEFETNEEVSNKKYLDKTIQITGKLTSIDALTNTAVLDEKIFLSFSKQETIIIKQNVSIKGRLIGYDNLLNEIKLDQCSLIK